jgi:hypothetical protein
MEQIADPSLVFLESTSGTENSTIINLSLVRMITDMRPGHCRLHFSEAHVVNLTGPAAIEVIDLLVSRAVMPNGLPLGPLVKKSLTSRSRKSSPEAATPGA